MKNLTKVFYAIVILVLATHSSWAQFSVAIKVTANIKDNKNFAFVRIDLEDSKHKVTRHKINEDGTFKLEYKEGGDDLYQLHFSKGMTWLAIMPGQHIQISYDGKNFTVTGSKDTDELLDFETRYKAMADKLEKQPAEKYRRLRAIVNKMNSGLAIYGTKNFWFDGNDLAFFEKTLKRVEKKATGKASLQRLLENLGRAKKVAIGATAPEIVLQNPAGKDVKLSSLRGRYVLVDFWASWCKPCRKENPHLVKAYKTYHNKGFTIYGVSLDQTKAAWLKAIKKDKLTWVQATDYKSWGTPVAKAYSVGALPSNFLIDPEGKIIAKGLKGDALSEKLAKVLEGK